jgi:hypothetical protein
MKHLDDVNLSYLAHLGRAYKVAFILMVHGLFPNIWKNKASDNLCNHTEQSDK